MASAIHLLLRELPPSPPRRFLTLSYPDHWNRIRFVLKRGLSVFPHFSSYEIWEEYSCRSLGCKCKASRIFLRVTERGQSARHTVQIHRFLTDQVAMEVIGTDDVNEYRRVLKAIFDTIRPIVLM